MVRAAFRKSLLKVSGNALNNSFRYYQHGRNLKRNGGKLNREAATNKMGGSCSAESHVKHGDTYDPVNGTAGLL